MVSLLTDKTLKNAFGISDDKEVLIEFDKKFATQTKNKGRLRSLDTYLKVGVNDETDAPLYMGVLKPSGEIATLDDYKSHQVHIANVELERIEQRKKKLENEIAELEIEREKFSDASWNVRDVYAKVAEEVAECEDLLEELKKETKHERRKLKSKIRNELQQMSFVEKLKFLMI
ncbi:TPA: hypothetical protein TT917_001169 [Streptococcus equi subsp. zooepidemicus]|uniref:hypothetical protein n=1 Tax=Streptococcus equi TaxID=1336 RepID=UPI001E4E4031|nr:hypothetical protein [Streptococcus equi]MCD3370318.1 hypothetical protein [Streptococcus equi subsp. zooepidemicus]MCD3379908.1 hypothetical protein [Streptococcus equi subsp. zooepidemicus]HEL0022409.1 hypothetical protein [Streptococcus equi subsp. zooepidemicus]HEL0040341.1 hypothetical protein [Streptococcus equi subsp. zooepidemicus]HEL0042323.1 hypothetical protein [Streptococcus equi subsp. zooepidemicus]